jgi:hypothetical protein
MARKKSTVFRARSQQSRQNTGSTRSISFKKNPSSPKRFVADLQGVAIGVVDPNDVIAFGDREPATLLHQFGSHSFVGRKVPFEHRRSLHPFRRANPIARFGFGKSLCHWRVQAHGVVFLLLRSSFAESCA